MAKENGFRFDAAGWLFWLALFLLLIGPCIWAAWQLIYSVYGSMYPIISGIIAAAIGAGLVSWAVNAVLQRRQKKLRLARRKEARKHR